MGIDEFTHVIRECVSDGLDNRMPADVGSPHLAEENWFTVEVEDDKFVLYISRYVEEED